MKIHLYTNNSISHWILLVIAIFLTSMVGGCNKENDTNNQYKIGAILPLTGPIGYLGQQELVGLKLGVEDINSRSESNGFSTKLIIEDFASQPANAVTVARKLIDVDKVDAMFVSTTSATRAVAPIAQAANIPLLSMSSDPTITNISPVVYRIFMNSSVEQGLLATRLATLGMKKIFVLYNQDRAFDAAYRELKELLTLKGIRNIAGETFEKTQMDFRSVIQKARQFKADAYVFIGFGSEFPLILSQWGDRSDGRYFGNYTFGTEGAQKQGKLLIEGIEFPTFVVRNESPELSAFIKRALALRGGKPLSDFMDHLYSYESMLFIEQCAREANSGIVRSLIQGCEKTKTFHGLSGTISVDDNRNAVVPMRLGVYHDGRLCNVE